MKALKPANRKAHFIDIENLCGTAILSTELVQEVKQEYFNVLQPGSDDVFIIGVSHFNLVAATFGWGAGVAKYVVQSGEDGADLALIEAMSLPCVLERFSRICIGSGDGLLTQAGKSLKQRGMLVEFAARQDCASREIFYSGCRYTLFPELAKREEYALVS